MADNVDEAQPPNVDDVGAEAQNREFGLHINARDRLFFAIFIKVAAVYVRLVPKWFRASLEILVLAKAIVLFTTLSYIHFTFSKNPLDCLEKIQDDWPRDGILQLQIVKDQMNISLPKYRPYFASKRNISLIANLTLPASNGQCPVEMESIVSDQSLFSKQDAGTTWEDSIIEDTYLHKRDTRTALLEKIKTTARKLQGYSTDFPNMQQLLQYYAYKPVKTHYVMEYALEYGFLRLSHETRQKLKIPVKVVTLDPKKDKCFGDSLSRFILDKFLGYDDVLMGSIKKIAEKENNQGYMKNVLTGEHYKFVTTWMGRTSYFISFLLMFVFTVSISTLLRFCHQQIFIFIVHLLHVMDWNVTYAFPIAPLFTVILSLVGMEAIMAEFFNDTTTSFYVILIVWAADQFESICCHTKLSQQFWPRFFFLYHFVFYAYHYRFNGQYSTMALAASWFFIQHSMLYFLHNYEIPAIEAEIRGQGNLAGNYLDDAVDLLVDDINIPAMNDMSFQQNTHQQQGAEEEHTQNTEPSPLLDSNEMENTATGLQDELREDPLQGVFTPGLGSAGQIPVSCMAQPPSDAIPGASECKSGTTAGPNAPEEPAENWSGTSQKGHSDLSQLPTCETIFPPSAAKDTDIYKDTRNADFNIINNKMELEAAGESDERVASGTVSSPHCVDRNLETSEVCIEDTTTNAVTQESYYRS